MQLSQHELFRAGSVMRGFSLIEMMVAMAIGLIVMAGAITVIVAISQSNSETIQSTRLTQELRALATVIANDIKRARHLNDPLAKVGQGAPCQPSTEPCYVLTPAYAAPPLPAATAPCLTYGYTGTTSSPGAYNYRAIGRSGSPGSVVLYQQTTAPYGACPNAGGQALNSPQIDITDLTFTRVAPGQVDLSITGQLRTGSASMNAIRRTFVQPVFIRSGKAN